MQPRLQIAGSDLRCTDDIGNLRWTVALNDIILSAEYTTDEGPYLDDYFFVFCVIEPGAAAFATCSFYNRRR